jgi:hypothetical protein
MADLQTKGCVHVRPGGGTHDVTVEETVVVAVVHIVVVVVHVGRFKQLQAEEIVCKRCLTKGLPTHLIFRGQGFRWRNLARYRHRKFLSLLSYLGQYCRCTLRDKKGVSGSTSPIDVCSSGRFSGLVLP